jgi:hypothetical protein
MNVESMLESAHIRLLPYMRGAYGRDVLYGLWCLVEQDGAAARLFYAQACTDETTRGDLVEFVTYFSSPERHLLIVTEKADTAILGLVWFDRVAGQEHALLGLWYRRKTTRLAREGTALACRYALHVLGYARLCGFTPWRTAVQHVLAIGWQQVATLPHFITIAGTPHDVYICTYTKRA